MKKIFIPLFLALTLSAVAHADQVITLKDGSQIKGDLAGIADGVYTIKTPVIGDVHVAAADVVSISNPSAAPAPEASTATAGAQQPADLSQKVQSAQNQLMANPQTAAELQQMIQDPEIAELLADPELVRIVTSHDVKAIAANPKAQELINNPKMRALMEKLKGSSAQ